MESDKQVTGYPSIDKPWLKYYSEEAVNAKVQECSIYQYIHNKNCNYYKSVAIQYFNNKITYKQLFLKIDKVARSLTSLGIKKGDIVTIQVLSMPQTIILLYALSRIGAIANLIYISESASGLHDILIDTNSKLYITLCSIYTKVLQAIKDTKVENVVLISAGEEADFITNLVIQSKTKKINTKNTMTWKQFINSADGDFNEVNDGALPIAMVYTGGTTGKSKAVVLTNNSINAFVFQYENGKLGFERGNTFLNMLPPFVAFGLTIGIHLPLSIGARNILMLDPTAKNAGTNFAKYRPNYFVNGIEAIENIIHNPKLQKSNLDYVKILAAGGESIPITLENQVNDFLFGHNCNQKLVVGYGMTEVGASVCTTSCNAVKVGTVGIPLPNSSVKIINPDNSKELSYMERGEICFFTPTMMKEYYHHKEETDNILRLHDDGNMWVHTGDIGFIDIDGFVSVVGRIKRIIELRVDGIYHKVFPRTIEEKFEEFTGVKGVTIVGISNIAAENKLIAFVVTEANQQWEQLEIELINYAEKHLEKWEKPAEYRKVDYFPRTEIGKVDYRKLEEMIAK